MIKKLFLSTSVVFILIGCGGIAKNTDNPESKSSRLGIDIENGSSFNYRNVEKKSYIPKGEALTEEMAYKFLNMTTFGATPDLAKELRTKGIEAWVEEQLSMPYIPKTQSILRGTLEWAKEFSPIYLHGNSIDEIINGKTVYNHNYYEWESFVSSSLFNNMLRDKSQLRQRVAYALSQTVIASDSVDSFFRYSFHALAYYYDFLLEHAFGNYGDVLYDVSLTPAMATFLTYNGNRKTYTTKGKVIQPDENYGRELMQLFSLGLYKLNMDGMQKANGTQFFETYTQKDISNMSRVFTGLTYPNSKRFGDNILRSDPIHPMVCEEAYHDMEEKVILGTTLPSGQSCEEDIKSAMQVLMKHDNIAPFISKKLILRLTKSNPKAEYIQRVAKVFNNNGNGVKGDLKAVVKAILLDKEIWENITKGDGTKIKEPYLAYMGMLRAFNVQPLPRIYYFNRDSGEKKHFNNTQNKLFLYQYYNSRNSYKSFAQAPLLSPTVFNFYQDTFVPNDKIMRMSNYVTPELQIQTTPYIIKFSQRIDSILQKNDKGGTTFMKYSDKNKYYDLKHFDSFIIDTAWVYTEALKVVQGDFNNIPRNSDKNALQTYKKIVEKIVDSLSLRLYGKYLNNEQKQIYIDNYAKDINIDKDNKELTLKKQLHKKVIQPILQQLIMSDDYMVQ